MKRQGILKPGAVIMLLAIGIFQQHIAVAQWISKADIPPSTIAGRWGALCFSINGHVYIGGGYVGNFTYLNDLWEYDPAADTWTQKSNLPGASNRTAAVSFVLNNNAYIGLGGEDFSVTVLNDLWEYDALNDTWTAKASLPATGRTDAASFVVNNKAYVVGGITNWGPFSATNEAWEYDPSADNWTQKTGHPLMYIYREAGFSINDKGYIIGGLAKLTPTGGDEALRYNYEYDPSLNTWSQKASMPDTGRQGIVAFAVGNIGYIGMGYGNAPDVYFNQFYSYDPFNDTWSSISSPMPPRGFGVAATVGNKAYVGGGESSLNFYDTFYNDWYEFSSSATGIPGAANSMNGVIVYPSPAADVLVINLANAAPDANYTYSFYGLSGNKLMEGNLSRHTVADVSGIATGIYLLQINGDQYQCQTLVSVSH